MSTETKWTAREVEANSDCWQVEGDDTICQLFYLDEETHDRLPIQQDRAAEHARLIAAAPELAGSAGAIFHRDCRYEGNNIVIPCSSHGEAIALVAKVRAALTKATGT